MRHTIPGTDWPAHLNIPLPRFGDLGASFSITLCDMLTPQGLQSGLELVWRPNLRLVECGTPYCVDLALLIQPPGDDAWPASSITNSAALYWGQIAFRLLQAGATRERLLTLESYRDSYCTLYSLDRVCIQNTTIVSSVSIAPRVLGAFQVPMAPQTWAPISARLTDQISRALGRPIKERST